MYNVPVPTFASHFRNSSATNSGPPCHPDRQALPRVFIDQRQHPQRSSVVRHRAHEVVAPHMIRSFRSQPHARPVIQPQPSSRPLFLRDFQPLAPPDALHPILAHLPAPGLQQRRDPPVAVAAVLAGRRDDPLRKRIFVRSLHRQIALRSAPLLQHPARLPLARTNFPPACSTASLRRSGLKVSLRYILQNLLLLGTQVMLRSRR